MWNDYDFDLGMCVNLPEYPFNQILYNNYCLSCSVVYLRGNKSIVIEKTAPICKHKKRKRKK